ncbi:MAG: hypothetical protein AAGG75_20040 [Bacteroidota bacterium]
MRHQLIILLLSLLSVLACKEKSYVYDVNEVAIGTNNGDKNKLKSNEQFLSILYANMFQKAISPTEMAALASLIRSIGDKQIAYETLVARFMADGAVAIPSDAEMRGDLAAFITATYKRFYVRLPSQAEKTYWVNYLSSRPNITAELVYLAFATSDEYYFY